MANFPATPADGQTFTTDLGTGYIYDSTRTAWLIKTQVVGLTGVQGTTGIQGQTGLQGAQGGVTGTINFMMYGNGSAITTGVKGDIKLPFGIRLNNWSMLAGETGSMVVALTMVPYATFPAGVTMATGATGPWLTSSIKNTGTTVGWTNPTGAQGDIISVNVTSVATVTRVDMALDYNRI